MVTEEKGEIIVVYFEEPPWLWLFQNSDHFIKGRYSCNKKPILGSKETLLVIKSQNLLYGAMKDFTVPHSIEQMPSITAWVILYANIDCVRLSNDLEAASLLIGGI